VFILFLSCVSLNVFDLYCLQLGDRKGMWPVENMGDGGGGHWLVRMQWRPAGWSVCLPLIIFHCTIKSRSSLLALAHPGCPGKRAIKRLWCGGGVFDCTLLCVSSFSSIFCIAVSSMLSTSV